VIVESNRCGKDVPGFRRRIRVSVLSVILISFLAIWIAAAVCSNSGLPAATGIAGQSTGILRPVQSLDGPQSGTFLIAARGLQDPNFAETVVLLIDYDAQGAFGLIINRPTRHTLAEIWPEIAGLEAHSVFLGGPVFPNRLLFLLRSNDAPQEMRRVVSGVHLGSDEPTLKRIIAKGEEEFRTYAGYSGWGPGQLDNEIARGDWHLTPAEKRFIFDPRPDEVWKELIQRVDTQVARLPQ
jgi:putative transcriptional regulator